MTSLFESTAGSSFPAHPIRIKNLRVLCAFAVQIQNQIGRSHEPGFSIAFYLHMNYKKTIKNQPQKSKIILYSKADAVNPACNPPGGAV